jgi:hypothetical protein
VTVCSKRYSTQSRSPSNQDMVVDGEKCARGKYSTCEYEMASDTVYQIDKMTAV